MTLPLTNVVPDWSFDVQIEWLQEIMTAELADPEFYLFRAIIELSSQISQESDDETMSAYLSSVWSQVLIRAPERQTEFQMSELKLFIQTCIDYYWALFCAY